MLGVKTRKLATIAAMVAVGIASPFAPAASAGTFQVTVGAPWNGSCLAALSPQPRFGASLGMVANGQCEANLASFPPVPVGSRASWEIDAPSGIKIDRVAITSLFVQSVNNNLGWGGGDYWSGGGSQWTAGMQVADTNSVNPNINSSYYGVQLVCGWSPCNNTAAIDVNGAQITAEEDQGPGLTALGANNLWYQSGRWVRNDNGDGGWPIALASSDPSGVCNMWAVVNNHVVQGPAAAPNPAVWHQCPDQTWSTGQGAVIDTRDYVPSAGQLNLELDAVNAAGVGSRVAETLNVDNNPVGVSLSTPNDADTTQWVGHPVTVDVAASAGPSGVGGMVCSTDGGAKQSYPAGGVSVDGDGVHSVSCTAWNQAEGPNGSDATGTRSLAVRIDEAPPTTRFEPENPGDPTGLVVDTSDSESGVAGGQIEMRPASGGSWTPLPTQFDGQHLLARFDDAGLNGPYQFQATACDNVGNCSATGQQLALPLRIASSSKVSFRQIVNPLQARVVRERVRVGWHWAKVRRHGRVVRVKRGGHLRTIKVVRIVRRCTNHRVRVARHRWRIRHTCNTPHLRLTTKQRVRFGRKVTIHGLLTTAQGVPLASAPVQIMTAADNQLAAFSPAATATTGADGSWTAILPAGPSRLIRANYGGTSTVLPASGLAKVNVPAKVMLTSIAPNRLPWGNAVRISGRVLGGYIPASSKLLRLDIGVVGLSKIQGIPDIAPDGRFTVTYTFGPGRGVVRFWFMVSTLAEADFPFAPSHSRRLTIVVGVPTPLVVGSAVHHHRRAHRRHRTHQRHHHRRRKR